MGARLDSLRLLLRSPGEWSARWYREKNHMDLAALRPASWRPIPRDDTEDAADEDLPPVPRDAGRDPR